MLRRTAAWLWEIPWAESEATWDRKLEPRTRYPREMQLVVPVAPARGMGGVWLPTAFHMWSFRWTLTEKGWCLSHDGRDLALDSTVGLQEALASDRETGEQLAVEKLPPDCLPGWERRGLWNSRRTECSVLPGVLHR